MSDELSDQSSTMVYVRIGVVFHKSLFHTVSLINQLIQEQPFFNSVTPLLNRLQIKFKR